ncbi:hypothetical protein ABVT39_004456 [Epinephelus coioides]
MKDNKYTGVSMLDVSKSAWDSRRSFSCSVTHPGGSKSVTLQKPPPPPTYPKTVSKVPITVTLTQSSPKEIFSNNQAKFECVITGTDQSVINDLQIIWQVDGQNVTDNIETKPGSKKISTMTRAHTDWQSINKVRCSAIRDNMTPLIQELTIQKGDGSDPKVTVHILPSEDIDKQAQGSEVTLVCLVSSRAQQDYYIAWREDTGQNTGTYSDGINFPPQKIQNGYLVTSIYITTKDKWNTTKFSCNVWPAGRNKSMKSRDVSYALSNSVEYFALSCTDGAVEEDEYSSLWSTTSSFIFLFICSLLYSTIISLVKIK